MRLRVIPSFCEYQGARFAHGKIDRDKFIHPFRWVTNKGQILKVKDMATPHLFFSFRMLFNHSVPPVFRVGAFKRYPDVPNWSVEYRQLALEKLLKEIALRADLDADQAAEIKDIQANCEVLSQKYDVRDLLADKRLV
jgi:hypothetical protein